MDELLILFAVKTQLRNLASKLDLTTLQSKLHSLGNRAKRSKISFNREKCKVLYLERENTGHYKGRGLEALGGGTWVWSLTMSWKWDNKVRLMLKGLRVLDSIRRNLLNAALWRPCSRTMWKILGIISKGTLTKTGWVEAKEVKQGLENRPMELGMMNLEDWK